MDKEYVRLNGAKVFVDTIESITPVWSLISPDTAPEYKVTCKSGASYQITNKAAKNARLI
jgi:hypothetical protein